MKHYFKTRKRFVEHPLMKACSIVDKKATLPVWNDCTEQYNLTETVRKIESIARSAEAQAKEDARG